MKKITTTMLLLVSMLLTAAQAQATDYGIYIGGVQLTSSLTKMTSSTHPAIVTNDYGEVSYNATTNTLTFNSVVVEPKKGYRDAAVYFERNAIAKGLTVKFKGNCKILGTQLMHGMYFNGMYASDPDINIVGEYSQARVIGQNTGIYTYLHCTLNIKGFNGVCFDSDPGDGDDCFFYTQGGYSNTSTTMGYGISGMEDNKVNIVYSKVLFNGTTKGVSNVAVNVENASLYDDYSWKSGSVTYYQVGTLLGQSYDISIGETPITEYNATDVKSDVLKSGKVSYDANSHTLYLYNVVIESTDKNIIPISSYSGSALNISLSGKNTLRTVSGANALFLWDSRNQANSKQGSFDDASAAGPKRTRSLNDQSLTLFSGSGSLSITRGNFNTNKDLRISETTLTVEGNLQGNGYHYPGLEIIRANVEAGSLSGFESFKLTDCVIQQPSGATYVESKKAMSTTGKVVISNYKEYDIWVAGTQVTTLNAANVESPYLTEGTIWYDANAKTLCLRDIWLQTEYSEENWHQKTALMVNPLDVRTIKIYGACTISSGDYVSLYITGGNTTTSLPTVTIQGVGESSLYIMYGEGSRRFIQPAISLDNVNLVIEDLPYVYLSGAEAAISGNPNTTTHQLAFKNCSVQLSSNDVILHNITKLTLDGVVIADPSGAKFNSTKKTIVDGQGNPVRIYCMIDKKENQQDEFLLSLMAAGVGVPWPVTDYTWDFVEAAREEGYLLNGDMEYDGNTNTLTITDADIVTDFGGIYSWSTKPFTLKVVGNCSVTANSAAVGACSDFTIVGDGADKSSLTVVSNEDFAVWTWGSTLTVKDITLDATGKQYGLYGFGYVKLFVEGSNISAQCTDFMGAKGARYAPKVFKARNFENGENAMREPQLPVGKLSPETSSTGIPAAAICDFAEMTPSDGTVLPVQYTYDTKVKALVDESGEPAFTMHATNGIAEITHTVPASMRTYTLQGVRTTDTTQKGIYIINGKKVVKK